VGCRAVAILLFIRVAPFWSVSQRRKTKSWEREGGEQKQKNLRTRKKNKKNKKRRRSKKGRPERI